MEADAQRLQTEIKLQRAFIKLVGEQGFERVTVRQLTTEAQINRGTFLSPLFRQVRFTNAVRK